MKRAEHQMIERYVRGTMTGTEKMEFERALAGSDELRFMVEAERGIVSVLNADKDAVPSAAVEPPAHLIAKLRSTPAKSSGSTLFPGHTFFLSVHVWIAVIACIAVGSAAAGVFFSSVFNPSAEQAPVLLRDTVYVPVVPSTATAPIHTTPAEREPRAEHSEPAAITKTNVPVTAPDPERDVPAPPSTTTDQPEGDREALKELLEQSERTVPVGIKRSDSVEIRVKLEK